MKIRHQFGIESKNEGIMFIIGREFKNDSYRWNLINFTNFTLGNVKIKGWAERREWQIDWRIITPFHIEKNGTKIPIIYDLDKLCELAVTDLTAFEKELCKIAGVQDGLKKDEITIGSSFTFVDGLIWIGIGEYSGIRNEKTLSFNGIPIANWKMNGYLVWIEKEQRWRAKNIQLHRKMDLPQGTIREYCDIRDYYEVEEFVQPIKNELISLFDAIRSVNFDTIKNMLKILSNFTPLKEVDITLSYNAKEDNFHVEVSGSYWFFRIDHMEKNDKVSEIAETLKWLIEKVKEKGDDRRLRAYCRKIAKYRY